MKSKLDLSQFEWLDRQRHILSEVEARKGHMQRVSADGTVEDSPAVGYSSRGPTGVAQVPDYVAATRQPRS